MGNEWHYTQSGQPAVAPITTAQLKQLAATGQLQPTDLVWQEGMTDWVVASAVKGLFPATKGTAATGAIQKDRSTKTDLQPIEAATARRTGLSLHPLLVLLLTAVTLGLFGLWYAWRVNSHYSARAAQRASDAGGRVLGRVRHPLWVGLLTQLTCGLYLYYWVYRVLVECSAYTDRNEIEPRTELSLMLIFPPYLVFLVIYRVPDMVRRTQHVGGVTEAAGLSNMELVLNPFLVLFLPLLCMMYQDALNQVWVNAP
jgi:hypothetical protein